MIKSDNGKEVWLQNIHHFSWRVVLKGKGNLNFAKIRTSELPILINSH